MYRTIGLYRDEIIDLCARIHEATIETGSVWPPKFGLYKSVLVTGSEGQDAARTGAETHRAADGPVARNDYG